MLNELKVFTGRAHPQLACEICSNLNIPLGRASIFKYSNDNSFVKIEESVREAHVAVIQPSCPPVNDGLMELLIMIDALKRASAKHITAITPYYPYARSDKKDQPRIPITARLVADLLTTAGATRIVTMDLHAAQVQGFFSIPVDHLTAIPLLADYYSSLGIGNLVVVAPDAGAAKLARNYARRLKAQMAIIDKHRIGNEEQVEMDSVVGSVEGKNALLVDDEIASGRTIIEAANILKRHGAREVFVASTHPTLSGDAINRINDSVITKVVVTNTVPIRVETVPSKFIVLSVAKLFSQALRRIHSGDSVSVLFE